MPRGRTPKPAHLKIIEGNREHRPIVPEVQPDRGDVPEPPAELGPDAQGEWRRIATELHALGLLRQVDRHGFAAYCQAYDHWINAERKLRKTGQLDETGTREHPLMKTSREAAAAMVRYGADFGLSPAARTRIASASFKQATSKFDGLIGREQPRRKTG